MTVLSDFNYIGFMNKLIKTTIGALLCAGLLSTSTAAQDYAWPLKIRPKFSSQFGDNRAGHWHAGIDFTTNGRPGYKLYAVNDGYVYRIRSAFWGYGKALYLKLNDGNYAVYGHLTRFDHKLEDYLNKKQTESHQYYQDLFFTPGQFPVKKGDYIALSGQSGAGAPHLHLEIRDKNNLTINPFKDIYQYDDNKTPILDHLVLKRYEDYAPGNYHELEFLTLNKTGSGYVSKDTISLYGQIVFSMAAYDPNGGYNYGIYGASVKLDNAEIFSFNHDKIDYATGGQIDYVRDLGLKMLCDEMLGLRKDNDKNIFYRLYIQPGDDQLFYGNHGYPAGVISSDELTEGVHQLEITFYDISDNSESIKLYLKKTTLNSPRISGMNIIGDSLIITSSDFNYDRIIDMQKRRNAVSPYKYIELNFDSRNQTVKFKLERNSDYRLRIIDSDGNCSPWTEFDPIVSQESITAYTDYLDMVLTNDEPILANRMSLDRYGVTPLPGNYIKALIPVPVENGYFGIDLQGDSSRHEFYVFNSGGEAFSPDSSVRIGVDDNQLYGQTLISISKPQKENGDYVFELTPENVLFKNPLEIIVDYARLNLNTKTHSLYYYWKTKDKWVYIGNGKAYNLITGQTGGGGKFGVLADLDPPYVGSVRPRRGSRISDRTPYLSCKIEDMLSGMSKESQLEMTIDGIWVPAYYDIDTKEFGYQVKNPLRRTSHTLKITATDNQGNTAVKTSVFTIR